MRQQSSRFVRCASQQRTTARQSLPLSKLQTTQQSHQARHAARLDTIAIFLSVNRSALVNNIVSLVNNNLKRQPHFCYSRHAPARHGWSQLRQSTTASRGQTDSKQAARRSDLERTWCVVHKAHLVSAATISASSAPRKEASDRCLRRGWSARPRRAVRAASKCCGIRVDGFELAVVRPAGVCFCGALRADLLRADVASCLAAQSAATRRTRLVPRLPPRACEPLRKGSTARPKLQRGRWHFDVRSIQALWNQVAAGECARRKCAATSRRGTLGTAGVSCLLHAGLHFLVPNALPLQETSPVSRSISV